MWSSGLSGKLVLGSPFGMSIFWGGGGIHTYTVSASEESGVPAVKQQERRRNIDQMLWEQAKSRQHFQHLRLTWDLAGGVQVQEAMGGLSHASARPPSPRGTPSTSVW